MSSHTTRNRRWLRAVLPAAVAGLCLLFAWEWERRTPLPPSPASPPRATALHSEAPRPAAATEKMVAAPEPERPAAEPRMPPEAFRSYPPGTRIPMRVPFVAAGIEVGPGLFLPPLNGVKVEDGIPAIGRSPRLPPPGPVVAKVVAADGQEYWEHEDGSYTSCTYSKIQTPDGATKEIVATQHGAIAPKQRGHSR